MTPDQDPHRNSPVLRGGAPFARARAALVLLHGRGGAAQEMLGLAQEIGCPNCAYLAPQATDHTWYPYSFLTPLERNQPWLTSALAKVEALLHDLDGQGFPANRVALLGFSQGACLALEYAARHPRRYAALIGLSGGLIGPPGTTWANPGSLAGTPVFLGCSDIDPHIPRDRVDESAQALEQLNGQVTKRIYPQMGHTINQDEIDFVRELLQRL